MKILNSKLLTVGLLLLLAWLLISFLDMNSKKAVLNKELFGYSAKIEQVKKNNEELRQFISFFNIPGFLEREARIRLNYKAPDEQVVYVYRDERTPSPAAPSDFISNLPNYKKWWYYLLGY